MGMSKMCIYYNLSTYSFVFFFHVFSGFNRAKYSSTGFNDVGSSRIAHGIYITWVRVPYSKSTNGHTGVNSIISLL